MNINKLVGKPYDKETYHCWHFIEEVLDVPTLKDVHVDTAKGDVEKYKGLFEEIFIPENYCIVLLGSSTNTHPSQILMGFAQSAFISIVQASAFETSQSI